jgi:uncharacterized membrane protein
MQPLNHDEYSKHLHGPFYFNKTDQRLFIPTATGFTLNFAKQMAKVLGWLFALVVVGVLVWCVVITIANSNGLPNR